MNLRNLPNSLSQHQKIFFSSTLGQLRKSSDDLGYHSSSLFSVVRVKVKIGTQVDLGVWRRSHLLLLGGGGGGGVV